MRSKLYKLALWYIGRCNAKWERYTYIVKPLERLTYLNFGKYKLYYGADAEWQKFSKYKVLDDAIQKLAEYENAEEKGLLLRLPCKVGTPVYMIMQDCGGDTLDCRYRDCEGCSYLYGFVETNMFDTYMVDDIGKTVFLTQKEAEQALKQMGE